MKNHFEALIKVLYEQAQKIIELFLKTNRQDDNAQINIPQDFTAEFFSLVDKVNLSLMKDNDNFYGYFLFQMGREIKFDMASPTAVNFERR